MHRDWIDYAGFIFNALATTAGLFGLFLAIRAYQVAKAAGSTAFELEILRELSNLLDGIVNRDERGEAGLLPQIDGSVLSKVWLLPEDDLPVWNLLTKLEYDRVKEIRKNPAVVKSLATDPENDDDDFFASVVTVMYDELHQAMRRRTE
ncbi:hypothetical protein AB0F68_04450 [Micromonospora sp. NPDC023966]|uniref:hypothetical protein n=1 Tax=Micromonospora sp. NPDC023966 TaxID=3154699 RepID=UPI0034063B77